MKENKYDDLEFFNEYSKMSRSVEGLTAAGEWHELKKMLPDFKDKKVLDLGCGFGWHCVYAAENGAKKVIGIDISERMLDEARKKTSSSVVEYINKPIEDIEYEQNSFDIVISSLAFHYIESFDSICQNVYKCLCGGGSFVFSVEHPVFTSQGTQDWIYGDNKERLYWPVDNYFHEGIREAIFLGKKVHKYHRTLTTYINSLIKYGFQIKSIVEPKPSDELLKSNADMQDELRRPMMLLISAEKICK